MQRKQGRRVCLPGAAFYCSCLSQVPVFRPLPPSLPLVFSSSRVPSPYRPLTLAREAPRRADSEARANTSVFRSAALQLAKQCSDEQRAAHTCASQHPPNISVHPIYTNLSSTPASGPSRMPALQAGANEITVHATPSLFFLARARSVLPRAQERDEAFVIAAP